MGLGWLIPGSWMGLIKTWPGGSIWEKTHHKIHSRSSRYPYDPDPDHEKTRSARFTLNPELMSLINMEPSNLAQNQWVLLSKNINYTQNWRIFLLTKLLNPNLMVPLKTKEPANFSLNKQGKAKLSTYRIMILASQGQVYCHDMPVVNQPLPTWMHGVTKKERRVVLSPSDPSNTQSAFSVQTHILLGFANGIWLTILQSKADNRSSTPSHASSLGWQTTNLYSILLPTDICYSHD